MSTPLGRRPFLGSLASLAGVAAVAPGSALAAADPGYGSASAAAAGTWDLSWLDKLQGKHRQVFSAGAGGPMSMAVVTNWLDAHEEVFGLKPPAVNALIGISVRAFPINCEELIAGLNPGVKLVPAHTMALGLAQEHGCTYEQLG